MRSDRARTSTIRRRQLAVASLLVLVAGVATFLAATAAGKMQSTKIDRNLCETKHGGKFVDIPGFPGEKIDRRLLEDVKWLVRKYKIFITDGYALEGHARNGEHPIGLALDIVPNKAEGGSWRKITKLARWAEPEQNEPKAPFRWVGYNGDSGHGRGDHLHLSWLHSETDYNDPARLVYTRNCPKKSSGRPTGERPGDGPDDGPVEEPAEESPERSERPRANGPEGGGVGANRGYTGDGGISPRRLERLRAIGPQHD
jgi:hypothetical protein